ncbi:hypothetical protein [Anaeromicropila herbilytica]|uniref:Uncharacterized protein n=1 Tax=Anaeromicropila herbilytica TaxID=2785025 RepID=A0A7R7ELB8_9FIRM|nr:hypothetical protein [Anaeromicropila herbilytica]BCN30602.1 hypothetical protein bsdtb5_18970 [Anaeromicropila herbilytica]
MEDFMALKFLDKLKPIFHKMGVDYEVMRKIIQMKLLLDGRRVPTVFSGNNQKAKKDSNRFLASLWVYILMGLILIPFVIMKNNYIYQMGIVFGIIMFFVMSSLMSDFSNVILDTKDKNIIGIRPVDFKTIRFAKTIHITIYMFFITAALVGPALVVSLFTQGIAFFLIFLFLIILVDLFCIVLTSLVYALILKFFDGEKLKDIINYVQIILSLVIMIGYQFIGRLFDIVDLKIEFVPKWWQYLIIPIWFSAPFEMLKKSDINLNFIIFTIMAIIVPILAMVLFINKMSKFEMNLNKLSNHYQNKKIDRKGKVPFLSKIICRTKEERIFYRFASDIMKQERDFKLKVYPSIGFSIIFPFIFLFQQLSDNTFKEISKGKCYLFIYFCGLLIPSIITLMQCSEKYKGAWIYKVIPINNMEAVFKGTIKALLCKILLPIFLVEAILFGVLFGERIIPDLFLVFINLMLYITLCFMLIKKALPFSVAFDSAQNDAGINFVLIFALAAIALVHLGFLSIPYGIYINLIISSIATLILWKIAFRISSDNIYEG